MSRDSSPASRLERHAAAVLAAVARTRMPENLRDDLRDFLQETFARVQAHREQAVLMRSVLTPEYEYIDSRIRKAAGALSPFDRSTPAIVLRRIKTRGLRTYGLERLPTLKRIRRALRRNQGRLSQERPHGDATLTASMNIEEV